MNEPIVEGEVRTESGCEMDLLFSSGSDFFDGHFDGAPILPGVVQTGTAVRAVGRMLGGKSRLAEIKKLKFAKVVHPDERVHLSIARKGDSEWAFAYTSEGGLCSSGILVYR